MSLQIRRAHAEDFVAILGINSASSPAVSRLDEAELSRLVALACVSWVATESDQVVGYMLAFSSSDSYDGAEFQYFLDTFDAPFLYVDQVAVRAEARRASIASRMYACLLSRSHELGIRALCCEVNLRPANPISLRFHQKLGFETIGELETSDGRSVALMRRETLRWSPASGPTPSTIATS